MNLKDYLKALGTDEARKAFAEKCQTSYGHLRNCCYAVSGKMLNPKICVSVERHSGQLVRRWDLRDDWHEIWPELIGALGAPKIKRAPRRLPAAVAA